MPVTRVRETYVNGDLHVKGDTDIEGSVKINGIDLEKELAELRAIVEALQEPDA